MNRLGAFVSSTPGKVALVAVIGAVLLIVGVVLTTGGSEPERTAILPDTTSTPAIDLPVETPTAMPEPEPTSAPNRADCRAILGTAFQSDDEAAWYRANCAGVDGPSVAAAGAAQVPIGDRLVIAKAGVDATVARANVSSSGVMPDPVGYFNAVWYDFSQLPGGYGGYANAGNLVLSGHVDCARCLNGGPGRAVFWGIRSLGLGDTARYETADGKTIEYEVTLSQSFSPSADWGAILDSETADMTLITCTGTFSGGEYSLRHVVAFKRKA